MIFMKWRLGILLWKHMKERWRRSGHTTLEIISGIMVFIILLLVKQILVQDRENMDRFSEDINLVDLAFTPQNNLSEAIMTNICADTMNSHSGLKDLKIQCYRYKDKDGIEQFLRNSAKLTESDTVIAVQFKDLDSQKMPRNLNYSIEFAGYHNQNVTKLGDLYYIYNDPMVVAKSATFFANLQWEINKGFMKSLTGEEVDHVISFDGVEEHTSTEMRVIHSFLVLCTVMAPLSFYMTTHAALVDEKRVGMMAILKLSGVRPSIVRLAHLIDSIVFATIFSTIIVSLLYITAIPILTYSNPFIIFFTFVLHFLTIISLTYITSSLSLNYQHSDSVAVLIYLMMFLINMLWGGRKFGKWAGVTIVYILLPHSPTFMFWNDVIAFEATGQGANFDNLLKVHDPSDSACVLAVWGLFVFQLFLILTFAWYLDCVRPGVYGIALPWNFLFHKRFWIHTCTKANKRREVNFHVTAERGKKMKVLRDNRYFEPMKKGAKTVIKLADVTKLFTVYGLHKKTTVGIDHVNLDVYKHSITVILGTNGSGKSSLMSIVAGMTSVTFGHVYIKGLDIETRLQDLRSDMAYCPQRDMTFDYLTVRENLLFFQNIRGSGRNSGTKICADQVIELFKLHDRADNYSVELSTGYRRCLQIACALIGDADVLVFDEPSLGMDAELKHRLWDLLLSIRKEKTILMSTSCMEEADALGDRIALLHHGKIKCYASPAFLKNAIGAEFKLSIRFSEKVDVKNVEDVIHDHIKEAEVPDTDDLRVLKHERSRMVVNLPSQHRDHFPKVFDVLEKNRSKLGILSMDVGISMEQVFLRFVEDDDIDFSLQLPEFISETPIRGWKLRRQQLFWLTKRAWQYVMCHPYQFVIVQVLVPLLAFIVITLASNSTSVYGKAYESLFTHKPTNTMLLIEPGKGYRRMFNLEPMYDLYPKVKFVSTDNVHRDLENLSKKPDKHKGNLIGIKNDLKRTEISYPITSAAALSTAVTVASNMYMFMYMPTRSSINVTFEPLSADRTFTQPKNLFLCYCWSMWVTFLVIIPLGPLVRLCIEEYYNGVRFNHLLMGCPPYIIWLSKLLAHLAIYLAIVPWSVMLVVKLLDKDHTIDRWNFLGALFLLLVLFGPAFLLHWYVLSFMLSKKRPVAKMYVISLCLGLITPIVVFFLSEASPAGGTGLKVCLFIFYSLANFIPAFTFSVGMGKISKVARNNAFCKLNFHLCPNDIADDIWVPKEVCCNSKGEPFSYFTSFRTGLFELVILILQCIFYWIILLLLQNRILQPWWNKIMRSPFEYTKPLQNPHKSVRVKAERLFVRERIEEFHKSTLEERQNHPSNVMVLVSDLFKTYHECCRQYIHAVKGISFAVKKGESLAILGKNGAGKSSTLGMLSGFKVMTSGIIYLDGHFWKEERNEYLHHVSVCRHGGFDNFFTGIQNIQYLAALFGYPAHDTYNIASRYLQYMGLSRYADTPFRSYSPGCTHRLSLCTALINSPSVALLDELCTNVDPYTLPLVTRAVQRLKSKMIACVIAEENMEWKQIDEICNRIAILDQGEIVTIGTVNEIRRTLASGYTVIIKLNVDKSYIVSEDNASLLSVMSGKSVKPSQEIEHLKLEFLNLFKSSLLVDEHMSMLYFHIKDPEKELTYSTMFNNLEALSHSFDIMEDYMIRETSISEVLCRISERIHGDARQRRESMKLMDLR